MPCPPRDFDRRLLEMPLPLSSPSRRAGASFKSSPGLFYEPAEASGFSSVSLPLSAHFTRRR